MWGLLLHSVLGQPSLDMGSRRNGIELNPWDSVYTEAGCGFPRVCLFLLDVSHFT
jgi:hypothetical protein